MATAPKKKRNGIDLYYAPAFLLFWFVLFFAVVLPVFLKLPNGLTLANEKHHQGKFIAERAERILYEFDKIGPKVTGSHANENVTVQLLLDNLEKVRHDMHHDLFELEVDVQVVSGAYVRWSVINMYQGIQNVVVKLSCKNSTSENYLLINSHFDSKPGSSGTGDDGAMVVIMLEVLRVLATNRDTFQHPMVFLFNGAEENALQASHGFITQHKWAKNCKALINLDCAGSGNREILFQSGPNHPWLMKIYNKHVVRPFASTVGEELFESKIIPSDTDFRIFRDYGHVPGLDFAHIYNGYVYHTTFDKFDVVPRGTLQATGDNILSLAKAFANALEMEDTEKYAEGHSVFYDFLGLFFICYTENQGKIINTCVSLAVIIAVAVSIWQTAAVEYISLSKILRTFALIFILHFIGVVLAVALPVLMAVIFDSGNRSMTWFASKWLVLGLYVSPALLGLTLPNLLYLSYKRICAPRSSVSFVQPLFPTVINYCFKIESTFLSLQDKLKKSFQIQIIQHAHAVILAILCIAGTFRGLRSSYIVLLPLFFYGVTLILNLVTTFYRRGYRWCTFIILGQVLPFMYTTYIFNILLVVLIPMMGRFGATSNPDLLISGLCALGTILSMGFVMPMWNTFRRSKIWLFGLLVITFVFSMIAITPIGFPYRPQTHVGRIHLLDARRVFYEYNGSVSLNESGYYFELQDRRLHHLIYEDVRFSEMKNLSYECNNYMVCGIPFYNTRMAKKVASGLWLPSKEPVVLPATPKLTMLNKTFDANRSTARFEFELSGPPHMSIFLQPLEGAAVFDWSFLKPLVHEPPYHIYLTYGKLNTPLKFHFDLKVTGKPVDKPLLKLGIAGHYIGSEYQPGVHVQKFIEQFPDYVFVMEWPSSYERYLF